MSDCLIGKRIYEEEFQSPVEQFLTSTEQFCEDAGRWVEEEVEQSVERFEEQAQRVCQSWPWPLNWLCSIVTTVVVVTVKVVVTVLKWVFYTICKTITIVTRVVVTLIIRVVKYFAVLVCALGKGEWAEAGQAVGGLYTSILDAAEDITRDSIELLADFTRGMLVLATDITADLTGAASNVICMFPTLTPEQQGTCRQRVEGVFAGVTKLIGGVIDAVTSIADGVALLGSGILRFFDVQKISEGLVKMTFGSTFAVWNVARAGTGLFIADGFREVSQTTGLISCIEGLIKELVPEGSRDQMRRAIGLDIGKVRVTWRVTLTRFYLESDAADPSVNPRLLHPTFINLYDLVAGFNEQWPPPWARPRNEMVIAGTTQRPTRDDIDRYLTEPPGRDPHAFFDTREVSRFRIYPMSRDILDRQIATAVDKARQIGLHLVFSVREQPAAAWFDARVSTQPDPIKGFGLDSVLSASLGRTPATWCPIAVANLVRDDLVLDPGIFESTEISPQQTPFSGLEYRDAWPDYVFRYVLIHEIGHYFGLVHQGHTGANHIMWSLASGIPPVSWETVGEAFLSAEPRFTGEDACMVWRFILTNAQACIPLPPPRPRG